MKPSLSVPRGFSETFLALWHSRNLPVMCTDVGLIHCDGPFLDTHGLHAWKMVMNYLFIIVCPLFFSVFLEFMAVGC